MGQFIRQDMAVSLGVMPALFSLLEVKWSQLRSLKEKSQQGPEVFLEDMYGLRKYFLENPSYDGVEYVMAPLLGIFKNEL
jgi:hypothetical protein